MTEKTKTITLTPDQARIHYFALKTHIKRMKRTLGYSDRKIAEHQQDGDVPMALKVSLSKQQRIQYIINTENELNRMCEIFGEFENGTGEN